MKPMRTIVLLLLVLPIVLATPAHARSDDFGSTSEALSERLERALRTLDELNERIAREKIPLSAKLADVQSRLSDARAENQETVTLLNTRNLDLLGLRERIAQREEEARFLNTVLDEYILKFTTRIHKAEEQRYRAEIKAAQLAPENGQLSTEEVFTAQSDLLLHSLDRLEDVLGGTRFDGRAIDEGGRLQPGTFLVVGPAVLFRSADGEIVGTADQRLNSAEPAVTAFAVPETAALAARAVAGTGGAFPLDTTLGNAHKVEATTETLWEHIQKGGVVMIPIFAMAGAALLVALIKWVSLLFVRKPSPKRIRPMLEAVARRDEAGARDAARRIKGPAGRMLRNGIASIHEPRELVEEIMYEDVMTTRLKVQRLLPFIAICAASAPLLGLLGTVTGIINTFKLITVFGSGDVKMLSGGISEALVTTEFGLIVAIPSLLLHAFLSRRARGVVDQMEKSAITLVNEMSKAGYGRTVAVAPPDREQGARNGVPARDEDGRTRDEVRAAIADLLGPMVRGAAADAEPATAGAGASSADGRDER